MAFDLLGARNDGYSDQEIAEFLSGKTGFNLNSAVADGYGYDEIAEFLAKKAQQPEPEGTFSENLADAIKRPFAGFARTGLTAAKGAISDIDAVTNFVGLDDLIDSGEDNEAIRWINQAQENIEGWVDPNPSHFDQFLEGLGSFGAFAGAMAISPGAKARAAFRGAKGLRSLASKKGRQALAGKLAEEGISKAGLAGAYAGPLGFAGATGAGEAMQMVELAREQGIEVSQDQEDAAAALGTLIGFSELAPIEALLKGARKETLKGILPRVTQALITGGAEGLQEVSARLAQDLTAKGLYNPDQPVGDSAWQEFIIGGEVGAAADLLFNALSMRRKKGMTAETKAREEEVRKVIDEQKAQEAKKFKPQLSIIDQDADPIIKEAAQIENTLGRENMPIEGWQVLEEQTEDGTPQFFIANKAGEKVNQRPYASKDVATNVAERLTDRGTDLAIESSAIQSIDKAPQAYSPEARSGLVGFFTRVFHPKAAMLTPAQVNHIAGTTVQRDGKYDYEALSLEEAEQEGVKYEDMTAAQQINYQRRKNGIPITNSFSMSEIKPLLNRAGLNRLAEAQLAPVEPDVRYRVRMNKGKPEVFAVRTKAQEQTNKETGEKKVVRIKTGETGEVLINRPDIESGKRVPFKTKQEAENYKNYLNQKADSGDLLRADLMEDEAITVKHIRQLLKDKNVTDDLNSEAMRKLAEVVTGRKREGKAKIGQMTAGEKGLLYNKLKNLPQFAEPTALPVMQLHPYTSVLQGQQEQALTPEDQAVQKRIEERGKQQLEQYKLNQRVKLHILDYARQKRQNEAGDIELGARQYVVDPAMERTIEGEFVPAMQSIFLHTEALKTNPEYQELANKEGVTQEELDERLADLAIETMDHELLHWMRQADLLTDKEYEMLKKMATGRKFVGRDGKPQALTFKDGTTRERTYIEWAYEMYPNFRGNPEMLHEEAIAEMIKHGLSGRLKVGGPQKTLMQRIFDFLKGIVGIKSDGFNTFDELIAGIQGGAVAAREEGVIRTERELLRKTGKMVQERENAAAATPTGQSRPDFESRRVFHGSPYKWDRPDLSKVGMGEGAQAYGHGFYVAENPRVANQYRSFVSHDAAPFKYKGETLKTSNIDTGDRAVDMVLSDLFMAKGDIKEAKNITKDRIAYLTDDQFPPEFVLDELVDAKRSLELFDDIAKDVEYKLPQGYLYELDLPDETIDKMLDWDKPLSEQPESVKLALAMMDESLGRSGRKTKYNLDSDMTGREIHSAIRDGLRNADWGRLGLSANDYDEATSKYLNSLGIPGIKYFDGNSRSKGKGTRNFVIFDENIIQPLKRNNKDILKQVKSQIPNADKLMKQFGVDDEYLSRRLEQAAKENIDVDQVWYNGTDRVVKRFQGKRGIEVFVSLDPDYANQYTGVYGGIKTPYLPGEQPDVSAPVIYPLLIKKGYASKTANPNDPNAFVEEFQVSVDKETNEITSMPMVLDGTKVFNPKSPEHIALIEETMAQATTDQVLQYVAEGTTGVQSFDRWLKEEIAKELAGTKALARDMNPDDLLEFLDEFEGDFEGDFFAAAEAASKSKYADKIAEKAAKDYASSEQFRKDVENKYQYEKELTEIDYGYREKLFDEYFQAVRGQIERWDIGSQNSLNELKQGEHIYSNIEPLVPYMKMNGFEAVVDYEYLNQPATGLGIFKGTNVKGLFAKFDRSAVPEGMRYEDDLTHSRRLDVSQEMMDEAVQKNAQEAETAFKVYETPRYSTQADPYAQVIARNPDLAEADDDVFYAIGRAVHEPDVEQAIQAVIGEPRQPAHTMDLYADATGANKDWTWFQHYMTKAKQELVNRYAKLEYLNWTTELRNNLADASSISAALHADRAAAVIAASFRHGIPIYHNGWTFVLNKAIAEDMAKRGQPLSIPEGIDLDKIKSLAQVLAPLHKWRNPITGEDENIMHVAQAYAIVMRGKRLSETDGKEVPVKWNSEYAQKIRQEVEKYTDPETGENVIKRWWDEWQEYNSHVIKFMQDTGVLTEETAKAWRDHSDYYPFYRLAEGAEDKENYRYTPKVFSGLTRAVHIRKLKGGKEPVNMGMEEAIVMNLSAAIQMGMKNVAQQRIVRDMKDLGLAEMVSPKSTTERDFVVKFRVNGIEKAALIHDPLVYESMQPLSGTDMVHMVRKTIGAPASFLREMITRDPGFMMVNLFRDSLATYVTSGADIKPLYSSFKALNQSMTTLEQLGVAGGYDFKNDEKGIKKIAGQEFEKMGYGDGSALSLFKKLWWASERWSSKSDAVARNAVFNSVLARTGNFAEASFQALEVINFGRHGRNPGMRMLNAVVPFLNARFQGLDVFYRAARGRYTVDRALDKNRVMLSAYARGASLGLATMLYYLMYGDDDQYKDQPDFVKDNYWIFPNSSGVPVTIPIPFEVGLIFKTIPENILARFMSGREGDEVPDWMQAIQNFSLAGQKGKYDVRSDREVAQSLKRSLYSTMEISPYMIQAIGPVLEGWMNYNSFTGRQLVPQYLLDNKEAGEQQEYYTNELFKFLSSKEGLGLNISPQRLQHVVEGYLGTLGVYLLDAIDAAARSKALRGDFKAVMPKMNWWEYPVIKRFTADPQGRGMVQDAYELHKELDKIQSTFTSMRNDGRVDEARAYIKNRAELLALRGSTKNVKKLLDKYRKHRDLIMKSDEPPDWKRFQMEQLDYRLNKTLRQIIPMLEEKADLPFTNMRLYK